jgi:hypothetical protein
MLDILACFLTAASMETNITKRIRPVFNRIVYGQSLDAKSIVAHSDLSLWLEISEKKGPRCHGPSGGIALV